MEHLPFPVDSPHQSLRARCYIPATDVVDCTCASQNAIFFFQRWASHAPVPKLSGRDLRETACEVQRWLFFGLISWSISRHVRAGEFSREQVIDSTNLPEILRINRDQIQIKERFEGILRSTERELRTFETAIDRSRTETLVLHEVQCVILSIRVLTDSLWRTRRNSPEYAAPEHMRHHENYENPYSSPGTDCDILRQRMRVEDGWCKAMVGRILTQCTASTAYYLSSIRRAGGGGDIALHTDCSAVECRLNVDGNIYRQSHCTTCRDTSCRMVEAPLERVLDIINQGGFPVVKMVGESLEVRKAEFKMDYTAITHVWSGGLGNPERNAMWLCQLKEIMTLPRLSREGIDSHNAPHGPETILPRVWDVAMDPSQLQRKRPMEWFWIDTLCVPRTANQNDNAHRKVVEERRQDSINRMTQTYAAASSVILLDTEVQRFPFQTSSNRGDYGNDMLAAFARTFCSGWMMRCWTYQEAAMASELLVQHRDVPFVLSIARAKLMQKNQELLREGTYEQIDDMMDELSVWFSRLPGTRDNSRFKARQTIAQASPEIFRRIWNDLGARTTGRPKDRLQIFALLVDLAPTDLLELPVNTRLKAILKAQPSLPLALLFQRPLTVEQLLEDEASSEDQAYPLPTKVRSEALPHQLGWMKRDENGSPHLYFDTELIDEGRTQPSLFLLGSLTFEGDMTHKVYDRVSDCDFNICFGSIEDCLLVSSSDRVFLMVSSELRREDALAIAFREVPGIILCQTNNEDHVLRRPGRPNHIQRFRRICSVLCDSLVESTGHQSTRRLEAVRQHWKGDWEYQIYCGMASARPA